MLPRNIHLPAVIQDALAFGASSLGSSGHSVPLQLYSNSDVSVHQQNAGLELMLRNADHNDDLWYRTELNVNKIKACDLHIAELYANLEVKLAGLTKLNSALSAVKDIQIQAVKTKDLLAEVEQQLSDCAVAILIMEDTREMVASKRREKAEREARSRQLQEERLKTFEEEFKRDLLRFKETGEIETPLCQVASPCDLSEINLEQDEDDQQALSRFLESSGELDSEEAENDLEKMDRVSRSSVDGKTDHDQDLNRVDGEL